MCVIGAFAEGTHASARITQQNSCQKALCNRCSVYLGNELPNNKMCVCNHFGPHSTMRNEITSK